jgi:Fe-S-cluster-containing hydrogenase component 2
MKRKIIEINENKCNGCGICTDVCAEAALEIIDDKAKLIKDFYCDGMGACLNVCPTGALKIVEKESKSYNPKKTYQHVKKLRGKTEANKIHGIDKLKNENFKKPKMKCGCPGTMIKDFSKEKNNQSKTKKDKIPYQKSTLSHWPIQLKLLNPETPYFKNADLLIASDCTAFSFPDFQNRFLKGKKLMILCPKLDENIEEYIEKLSHIFKTQSPQSITILKMEVPCCHKTSQIVEEALKRSKKNIIIKDYTLSIKGELV